jgi:tripartite-type tricarboxylate transporter receptor subunit TctC
VVRRALSRPADHAAGALRPGGIADLTARAVAEAMARTLGQPVVVDNKPSAGSIVASQAVATARPDGHTLLLMSNGNAVSVGLFKKLPYDPQKDFAPVSTLGFFDLGLFVPAANSRFATLRTRWLRQGAHPGKLNVGTIAVGSTQHLAAKLFETVAGVDALVVPYKGSPAVLTALRSGEIDLAFEIVGPMLPQVQAGVVRRWPCRRPAQPGAARGAHGAAGGRGRLQRGQLERLAAPAGTPPRWSTVLNRAVREAVASPAVQDKLGKLGMRLQAGTPAELQALLGSEIRRWGEVIRAAKIEPE